MFWSRKQIIDQIYACNISVKEDHNLSQHINTLWSDQTNTHALFADYVLMSPVYCI